MAGSLDRRDFMHLSAALATGAGFYAAGEVRAQDDTKPKGPMEKLAVAAIGVGGKGSSDCDQAASLGNLVAICDIDENRVNQKGEKFPKAEKFFDFRELLDKLGKKVDAVVVSTPDHTHAVACAMAMRAGKHVYCQKPLTHSVAEARMLRQLAKDNKVCTQMGNQGTAGDQFRTSVELVRSGVLGKIKEVHLWTNRPTGFWKQAPDLTSKPKSAPVPKHVKWDLFLGPAPEREYAPGIHPFAWRGFRDFGTGALGDMACHTANMPYMGLRLTTPLAVSAEAGEYNPETFPAWAKVTFEFALPDADAIKVIWYEGTRDGKKLTPPVELLQGTEKGYSGSGSLIVAENATLYSPDDYGSTRKFIGKGGKDIKTPEKTLPRRGGNTDLQMKAEWFEAIAKNDPSIALSNFEYASPLTESILLGNIAMIANGNKRLVYDAANMKFTGASEFDKYLSREYRSGWKL